MNVYVNTIFSSIWQVLGKKERQELKVLQSELTDSLVGESKLKQSGDKEWASTFEVIKGDFLRHLIS